MLYKNKSKQPSILFFFAVEVWIMQFCQIVNHILRKYQLYDSFRVIAIVSNNKIYLFYQDVNNSLKCFINFFNLRFHVKFFKFRETSSKLQRSTVLKFCCLLPLICIVTIVEIAYTPSFILNFSGYFRCFLLQRC